MILKHLKLLFILFCILMTQFALSDAIRSYHQLDLTSLTEYHRQLIMQRMELNNDVNIHVTQEQMDQILKFLYLTGDFEEISITQKETVYHIEIKQSERLQLIQISQDSPISGKEIETQLKIKKGDPIAIEDLPQVKSQIESLFKENGFLNVELNLTLENDQKNPFFKNLKIELSKFEQVKIKKIFIDNSNFTFKKSIEKKLKLYSGVLYTESNLVKIQSILNDELRKRSLFKAEISKLMVQELNSNSVNLIYTLNNTDIYKINFEGNTTFSRVRLLNALNLKSFKSSLPFPGQELSSKIKNYYIQNGFAGVDVQSTELFDKINQVKIITLNISEGTRIRIAKMEFSGRISADNSDYIKKFKASSVRLIQKDIYNKSDLNTSVENLITKLQNEGFIRAKLISSTIKYSKQRDTVTLLINIDEGPKYKVKSISFIGNSFFSSQELESSLGLSPLSNLNLIEVENSIKLIKKNYLKNGFIEMKILNEKENILQFNEENSEVDIVFKIDEGPQVKAQSILIEGNSMTRDEIIRIELDIKEGDLLTPDRIDESIARLQRTGFFSSIDLFTLEANSQVKDRTLVVKVVERDPGQITAGFGVNNDRILTLRGYLGIAYKNLFGTGRGLSLRFEGTNNIADFNFLEQKLTFGYLEPYLMNTRYRGRWNGTKAIYVTDFDLKKITELSQYNVLIEKDFTSNIVGSWEIWNYSRYHDYGFDKAINLENNISNSELVIATTGPSIEFDFRDNPFNPSRGTLLKLSAEYSSPDLGSTNFIEFLKSVMSLNQYTNIYNHEYIWANQLRMGLLQPLNDSKIHGVPWDKKGFSLGGRSTLRGFSGSDEIFPNRAELGVTDTYYLKTTAEMFLIKSEIRFPLFGILGGVLFYDGGSIKIDQLELEDTFRHSAGFGVRINTPVGPVNAEFGFKLDRKTNRLNPNGGTFAESPYAFHLSFGSF